MEVTRNGVKMLPDNAIQAIIPDGIRQQDMALNDVRTVLRRQTLISTSANLDFGQYMK